MTKKKMIIAVILTLVVAVAGIGACFAGTDGDQAMQGSTSAGGQDVGSSAAGAPGAPPDSNGAPPDSNGAPPDSNGGGPGGTSASDVTWTGATEITSATSTSGKSYSSTKADQNAVLIDTSENVSLTDATVTKTGGASASDSYSFFGINSGIMCKGGGTTTINGAGITTNAAGANGVFSYGSNSGQTNAKGDGTTVNISDSTIKTSAQGSGGIMTTYGGTTNAKNLTVTTSGGSSAPIRTDRGGGWVNVEGGSYTSSGQGSPAIYSTADVKVSNAKLISKASEGTCIEGTGTISLTDCDLTAMNNTLNGNATFYDTVMIYQSMSGDANSGTSAFTMKGGSLTSKKGHTFHVTNTNAEINLAKVAIKNSSDNVLLSVCDDGWSGGSNKAALNAKNQTLKGSVLVGSNSSLTMKLTGSSVFTGNTSGKIKNAKGKTVSTSIGTVNMTIGNGSTWKLTGDSYVSKLTCEGNIDYNGHKLYVNGKAYTESDPYGGNAASDKADNAAKDTSKNAAKVKVKGTKIRSLKAGKKSFTVKWKKVTGKKSSSRVNGYQLQYSAKKSFKSARSVTVSGYKKTTKKVTKLKAKKKYYVRIRTYKKVSGTKYYSAWSKAKIVNTKR